MTDLAGKVALITGASRGLGQAVARELAGRGAAVMLAARNQADCQAQAREIEASGAKAMGIGCDVADYDQVAGMMEAAGKHFGGLDIVINNAAIIEPIAPLAESDPALWARSISVNLIGPYNCMRAALPGFLDQGSGVVINVTTSAARIPFTHWSAYCAAKAGIAKLSATAQKEVAGTGVRIHEMLPGPMDTDMQVTIHATGLNLAAGGLPGVKGPAKLAAWLCTDEAADLAGGQAAILDPEIRCRAEIGE